jgi:predicted PurR-regulated permease PerM
MQETEQKKHPNHQRIKLAFFVTASLVTFALTWMVFRPFAMLIATALIAAIVVSPFHLWLWQVTKHHVRVCALIATITTFVGIGLPLALGTVFLVDEVAALKNIDPAFMQSPLWQMIPRDVQTAFGTLDVQSMVSTVAKYLSVNLGDVLASTSRIVVMALLFFITLYYLLAERETIYKNVLSLSPLSDTIDNNLIKRLTETIRAVVLGNVIVGCIQGALAFIGFLIFGLPNALIWGLITLLAAQVPVFGTAVVMVPAAAYLAMVGQIPAAIGLGLWSMLLVGTIDNILRPKLVEGKTKMHPFLVLLSMLGGVEFFGPIGLVLGPSVLAAALAFIEMYEEGVLTGGMKL